MPPRRFKPSGFTLVELMITLVIVGALAAIAIPSYLEYVEKTKRNQAIRDIAELSMAIERYHTENATYPASLSALPGTQPSTDPWGTAYQYLGIDVSPAPSSGSIRRDRNMNPLNSDFDLYSNGKDLATSVQLTSSNGKDDIVRAGNGGFIGLASEH